MELKTFTPSTPVCNEVSFENRTALNLGDNCGNFSSTGFCINANSACMPQEGSATWMCRCISGYAFRSGECTKAPSRLFVGGKISHRILLGTQPGEILRVNLSENVMNFNFMTFNAELRPQNENEIFTLETQGQHLKLISQEELADKATYTYVIYATAEVGTSVGSYVISDVIEIEFIIRSSADIIQNYTTHITDDTLDNQVVFYIPEQDFQQISSLRLDGNSLFVIDSNSGRVYTRSSVKDELTNNEFGKEIKLNLIDTDSSNIIVAYLYVLIIRTEFQVSVKEGTDADRIIGTISSISPNIGITISGIDPEYFYLTGNNLFRGNHYFDFDADSNQRNYKFDVMVTAPAFTTGQLTTLINITVSDENDQIPRFTRSMYDMPLLFSALSNVLVGFVTVEDSDTVGEISYEIESRYRNYLEINSLGAISTRIPVTELTNVTGFNTTTESLSVVVTARDGEGSSAATVHIQIRSPPDENLKLIFTGDIVEERPVGTNITSIFVKGYSNYQFIRKDEGLQKFTLNSTTGEVRSNKVFDREEESELDFVVTGTKEDALACSLSVLGHLVVTVIDINDNSPQFTMSQYTGSVMENLPAGTEIQLPIQIKATDRDAPQHAMITYGLLDDVSGTFSIDNNGKMKTLKQLDREAMSVYNITLLATDGENNGTASVIITILDDNDNSPEFASPIVSFQVQEDINVEQTAGTITATDNDEGKNGAIIYDVIGGSGYFQIDRNNGVIKVKHALDRERDAFFNITVVARDDGTNPRSSSVNVEITVIDVNDNEPEFDTSLQTSVREDVDCSTAFHSVIATDEDEGINKQIEYSLLSETEKFQIDQATGAISCRAGFTLDYENTTRHEISIQAKDKGTQSKSSIATLVILVEDVNDNSPEFSGDFADGVYDISLRSFNFEGNSKPLLVIPVDDKDSGTNGQVTLEVTGGNFQQFIVVDSASRLIKTKGNEKPAEGNYTAEITARDGGNRQARLTINFIISAAVSITDKVEFTQEEVEFSVTEGDNSLNFKINDISSYVTKHGKDIRYNIITSQDIFTIGEDSGEITVTKILDREQKSEYFFVTRATNKLDEADSDLILVKIIVTDINDNPPRFVKEKYIFITYENDMTTFPDHEHIEANDADDASNTRLRYRIRSAPCTDNFVLDENKGSLRVQTPLDYESLSEKYCRFQVEVTDSDTIPINTASVEVDVNILDVNDNPPVFNELKTKLSINEDAKVNDKVLDIPARVTDADDRGSGDVAFSINVEPDCLFNVEEELDGDQSIPVLRVKTSLDYETNQTSVCVITAYDQPEPEKGRPLSSSATFTISILDINDNAPVITGDPYDIEIPRDIERYKEILSGITATDEDTGNNAKLTFRLDEDAPTFGEYSGYFGVDGDTGSISVIYNLYTLQKDRVELIITVEDDGIPKLSSSTTVAITITDANFRPYFDVSEAYVELEEEHVIVQDVFKAVAKDINGTVVETCNCTYRIEDTTDSFEINSTSGIVRVLPNKVLNREKTPAIDLFIIGRDHGDPPKDTERLRLRVNVTDINDQSPVFVQDFNFELLQKAPSQTVIGVLSAVDADIGAFAVTRYTVVKVTIPNQPTLNISTNLIGIDESTGQMFLNDTIDRNASSDFIVQVKVKAEDTLDDNKYDFTDVIINVKFDNPNKNTPICQSESKTIDITKATENKTVVQINATDADSDINGEINYSITQGNFRDLFSIGEHTGLIKLSYSINKVVETEIYTRDFTLTIHVTDKGVVPLTGSCTVTVIFEGKPETCVENAKLTTVQTEKSVYQAAMIAMSIALSMFIFATLFVTYMYCTSPKGTLEESKSDEAKPYSPFEFNKNPGYFSAGNFDPSNLNAEDNLSAILGYEEPTPSAGMPNFEDVRRSEYTRNIVAEEPPPDYGGDDTSEEIDFETLNIRKVRTESRRQERFKQVYGKPDEQNRARREFQHNKSKSVFGRDRDEHSLFKGSDWDMKRFTQT